MRIRFVPALLLISALFVACPSRASDLALVGAKIYVSPTEPPIENGSVVVHDGRIVAVGWSASIVVPLSATVIDCKGLVVAAGFWNSHVPRKSVLGFLDGFFLTDPIASAHNPCT